MNARMCYANGIPYLVLIHNVSVLCVSDQQRNTEDIMLQKLTSNILSSENLKNDKKCVDHY